MIERVTYDKQSFKMLYSRVNKLKLIANKLKHRLKIVNITDLKRQLSHSKYSNQAVKSFVLVWLYWSHSYMLSL